MNDIEFVKERREAFLENKHTFPAVLNNGTLEANLQRRKSSSVLFQCGAHSHASNGRIYFVYFCSKNRKEWKKLKQMLIVLMSTSAVQANSLTNY